MKRKIKKILITFLMWLLKGKADTFKYQRTISNLKLDSINRKIERQYIKCIKDKMLQEIVVNIESQGCFEFEITENSERNGVDIMAKIHVLRF